VAEKIDIQPEHRVDAIAIKRAGAAAIAEELKGMTFEQQVEYWRRASEAFERKHAQLGPTRASA
jgi:hypothetical protein